MSADRPLANAPFSGGMPVRNLGWGWQLAYGIVMLVGGLLALLNPFAASVAATLVASFVFFMVGLLQIFLAVRDLHGTASRSVTGLFGLALCLFGILLAFDPLGGIVSLTLLIGFFFVTFGSARLWIALKMRDRRGWGWLAAAGTISIILGVGAMLFAAAGDVGLLGLFLAVELVLSGAASIAQSLSSRRSA
ncbi:HdeD family acid-resistance protein [Fulvimarina endophytica]|nr:DUF308 domain-containing protein [Fulvimarina endophytica]